MEKLRLYTFLFILISISACKKDAPEAVPEEQEATAFAEQISFEMNGKKYSSDVRSGSGRGNRQINIKPYTNPFSGRRYEYQTGGYFWYGEKDSTLFDTFYNFSSRKELISIKISFSKKFHNDQLRKSLNLIIPIDKLDLFKEGKQTFAVDLDKENTTEGVALSLNIIYEQEFKTLTSYMPGFTILIRPEMNKDIQQNSNFEITKVQKIDDNRIFVQAKFELNLFDEEGTLYRAENGFVEFKTSIKMENAVDMY
ncbi:hypothetical protein ACMA1I_11320 [Pontibacter sp. 13R65]|uniref:hypothetical protein n=1 Tax=Pontibacter sp. 13R65 TaxID=3127458 RepID=UPI00301DBE88